MHIVGVVVERDLVHVGNVSVRFILGGRDLAGIAVDLTFLPCLFGEIARNDVVRLARVHEVERNRRKLLARAALYEEHAVILGDVHQFAQVGFRLLHDGGKRLVAVGNFAHAHAGAGEIQKLFLRFFQYLEGKHGRPCRKVVNSHNLAPYDKI